VDITMQGELVSPPNFLRLAHNEYFAAVAAQHKSWLMTWHRHGTLNSVSYSRMSMVIDPCFRSFVIDDVHVHDPEFRFVT
jgi:hypothetical protein